MTKKKTSRSLNPRVGGATVPYPSVKGNPPGMGQSRTARRRRALKSGVDLSRPGYQVSASVPARLVSRRRAYSRISRSGVSNAFGDDIVVIEGSQVLSAVANSAGSSSLVADAQICPDGISGTLGALGDRYNKFFFTHLVFEFVPYQPNSTDGHGFAFGFNPEGVTEFALSFAALATLEHSMVLPMTGFLGGPDMNCLEVFPSRKTNPWYWNELDVATSGGARQTIQGLFNCRADSNITDATTWGTVWLHYVVEMCDITPDQGFTLRSVRRLLRDSGEIAKIQQLVDEAKERAEVAASGEDPGNKKGEAYAPASASGTRSGKGWSLV